MAAPPAGASPRNSPRRESSRHNARRQSFWRHDASAQSLLRRSSQANTAFTDPGHVMRALRHGFRRIQYRSDLIDGYLAATELTLTTSRPRAQ